MGFLTIIYFWIFVLLGGRGELENFLNFNKRSEGAAGRGGGVGILKNVKNCITNENIR